jgi:hypothetical protein
MTCYVSAETKKAIQHEAIERDMTLGEVITEGMQRRNTLVTEHDGTNKTD